MELITENRFRMKQALLEIMPEKIISFSQVDIKELNNISLKVIINSKFSVLQNKNNEWDIRTNNKIHSKIAIGKKGFIIGSWNFSDNSTNNMHESILKIEYDWNIKQKLEEYFDTLWERSTELK